MDKRSASRVRGMNIVLIRTDHLGDLVLTTPLMRELHGAGHHVDVICKQAHIPVLTGLPFVREVHALEAVSRDFPRCWKALGGWLRTRNYDRILLPYAHPRAILFAARWSGIRVSCMWGGLWSRVLGCRSLRSYILDKPRYIADIWLDLARDLGIEPESVYPQLRVEEAEKQRARTWLHGHGLSDSFIIIHPGCGGNTCNVPPGIYAELARLIQTQSPCGILVTGTGSEKKRFARYFADCACVQAMGHFSLREFMSVIALASCVVCVGTGPLHIATALGTPTVSPFCRKTGVSARVWGNPHENGVAVEPDPAWCEARARENNHCDFGGTVTPERLWHAIQSVWSPSLQN